jgi:hypothetical protein
MHKPCHIIDYLYFQQIYEKFNICIYLYFRELNIYLNSIQITYHPSNYPLTIPQY